jgi:hypothetical protein
MTKSQCNWCANRDLVLYSLPKPVIAQVRKVLDDRTQWIAVCSDKKQTREIEKMATVLKIPGKVFMVGDGNRQANKKGHVFTWPFKFWLPDLDSNQGPAD